MPRLACWKCGRQIYTVAPLEALFAEERRCPRCGAFLRDDRREAERRQDNRRSNPQHDPGPPRPTATAKRDATAKAKRDATAPTNGAPRTTKSAPAGDGERRVADRRTMRRRGGGGSKPRPGSENDQAGWND
jgi:hypothetical protein